MLKMNQIKKLLLAVYLICSTGVGVTAGTSQTITVNGVIVSGKTVSAITFSGDDAILTYSDGSTETAPMEQVVVAFTDSGTTGISDFVVAEYTGVVDGKLTLGGLKDGTLIRVYDASGRKKLSLKASAESTVVDVSGLEGGVYIMRTSNLVVKFVKR